MFVKHFRGISWKSPVFADFPTTLAPFSGQGRHIDGRRYDQRKFGIGFEKVANRCASRAKVTG